MPALPDIHTFNTLDICLLAILLLGGLIGLAKGLTHIILLIGAWIGAFICAFYGTVYIMPWTKQVITQPFLCSIITSFGIFLISLILFVLFIQNISDSIRKSFVGGIDRTLGMLLGLILGNGLIIGGLFISFLIWKTPIDRPVLIQTSKLMPFIIDEVDCISPFIPKHYFSLEHLKKLTKQIEYNAQDLTFRLANPQPYDIKSTSDTTTEYKNDQRHNLGRLFQNHTE